MNGHYHILYIKSLKKPFSSWINAGHSLPLFEGPPGFSLSSPGFDPWDVLSWASCWCFNFWEADGEFIISGDSECHVELSAAGFNRSLGVSLFGLINLTKALAPIQGFFLIKQVFELNSENATRNTPQSSQLC